MSKLIDVYSTAIAFKEQDLKNKNVVVIDVLRAGSTIITALNNGARGVIPASDMAEATKYAQNLDPVKYLLCGEKNGYKIEGFQLGNSPLEYTPEKVNDKTVILNTTNGTRAIARSHLAHKVVIGTFLNLERVIDELNKSEREVLLICAGTNNRISIEDLLCAGAIVHGLTQGKLPDDATDGAKMAFILFEKFGNNITEVVRKSNNGEWLAKEYGEDEVAYCCQVDGISTLPVWRERVITLDHGR